MAKVKHKLTKIGFIFDDILNEDEIEELRKAGLQFVSNNFFATRKFYHVDDDKKKMQLAIKILKQNEVIQKHNHLVFTTNNSLFNYIINEYKKKHIDFIKNNLN